MNRKSAFFNVRQVAYALSFALLFAVYVAFMKCAIHFFASPFGEDTNYRLGAILGIGADVLLGILLAVPILFLKNQKLAGLISLALAVVFFFITSGVGHYHAVFNRLPTIDTLLNMSHPGGLSSSILSHVPLWLVGVELLVPGLALYATAQILAPKWRVILADPQRRWIPLSLILGGALISCGISFSAKAQIFFGSVNPLVYLAISHRDGPFLGEGGEAGEGGSLRSLDDTIDNVQRTQGYTPIPKANPVYPYCKNRMIAPRENAAARSGILLILEGVGMSEMALRLEGGLVMPNLNRMAQAGMMFPNFFASGDRSSQGLVSIMSGVSSPTHIRPLMHAPLVNLEGFPRQLAEVGYDTFYLHGSDLSFEQQRAYLKKVGFQEIIEPKPGDEEDRLGWGKTDREMFRQLKKRIISHRQGSSSQYFGTLFTLSTHDPYAVPKEYENRIPGDDSHARFANSLAYLDEQLGDFYDWYEKNEKPRGTVLFITSDHTPILPAQDASVITNTGEFEYRFHIPLIVLGSPRQFADDRSQIERRMGGHLDIARSLVGQMGWDIAGCYHGTDLFLPPDRWPLHRKVVSLAGEHLEFVYVFDQEHRWMTNVKQRNLLLHNWKRDPFLAYNLLRIDGGGAGEMVQFIGDYLRLGYYLNKDNHYAPPQRNKKISPIETSSLQKPLLVSHRGNVEKRNGPGAIKENSLAAIENAIAKGALWVEIDVQITGDDVLVVFHDSEIETRGAGSIQIDSVRFEDLHSLPEGAHIPTLAEVLKRFAERVNFCVELKSQINSFASAELARQVIVMLEAYPNASKRFIVDSFSRTILSTIVAMSNLPAGYDLPQAPIKDEWLEYAANADFRWIYVHEDYAHGQLVEKARSYGLKVMVYTVNRVETMEKFAGAMPDGVITDRIGLWPGEFRGAGKGKTD